MFTSFCNFYIIPRIKRAIGALTSNGRGPWLPWWFRQVKLPSHCARSCELLWHSEVKILALGECRSRSWNDAASNQLLWEQASDWISVLLLCHRISWHLSWMLLTCCCMMLQMHHFFPMLRTKNKKCLPALYDSKSQSSCPPKSSASIWVYICFNNFISSSNAWSQDTKAAVLERNYKHCILDSWWWQIVKQLLYNKDSQLPKACGNIAVPSDFQVDALWYNDCNTMLL